MRTFSLSHCGLRESTGDTRAVLTLLKFNIHMLKSKGQYWHRFGRSVSDKDGLMCSFVDDVCSGGSDGKDLSVTFVWRSCGHKHLAAPPIMRTLIH